jgi:hypothetical protein
VQPDASTPFSSTEELLASLKIKIFKEPHLFNRTVIITEYL